LRGLLQFITKKKMSKANKLCALVSKINRANVPKSLRETALSIAFNSQVKMAAVAGVHIESLTPEQSVVHLKNRLRVQNHIGGVHACGMALLAESASGMVFGMNVPDSSIPLIKSMKMEYVKRAQGDLKAIASLTTNQIHNIQHAEKGEVQVDVVLTDATGASPVKCEMLWAWVPKQRKTK